MRRLIGLLILFNSNLIFGWSQTCPAGRTNIYFGNGVDNTSDKAHSSSDDLKQLILSRLGPPSPQQSIEPSCLSFSLAYDSKFFFQNDPSNPLTIFNTLLQILQAGGLQLTQQYLSQLWLWSTDPNNAPNWVNQAITLALINANSVSQPDLQLQVLNYNFDLSNNVKVLVVAHSQGNFYANQAYSQLSSRQ